MQPMAMAPPPVKRKGGIALSIGIALVVFGIGGGVLGAVLGFQNLQHRVDALQRVPLTAGGTLNLAQSGTYKVYVERPYSGSSGTPNIAIRGPEGDPIALQFDSVSETYDAGGRHGRKVGKFYASRTGRYELSVGDGGSNGPGQIAIGRRSPVGALAVLGFAILGGIAAVIVGIILIIVGAVRRSRSNRPPTVGYPGAGGWGTPPPGAPGAGGWAGPPPPGAPGAGGWGQPATSGGWAPPPGAPGPTWTPPQTDANTTWNPPSPPST
jgi:hypothetical protein